MNQVQKLLAFVIAIPVFVLRTARNWAAIVIGFSLALLAFVLAHAARWSHDLAQRIADGLPVVPWGRWKS